MVAPLTHLTKNIAKFIWTKECEETVFGVKCALTHAPILTLLILGEPFEVIGDASLVGVEVVLLQNGKLIAFEGYKLTPIEKSYTT